MKLVTDKRHIKVSKDILIYALHPSTTRNKRAQRALERSPETEDV